MFGALRLPRTILFGHGQRGALGSIASHFGRRALICTDQRQASQPEFVAMLADLAAHCVEARVFDGTIPDLPLASIEACIAGLGGDAFDVIVGIGGGSSMDMAKVIAILLKHGGSPRDYYGEFAVPGPLLPLIAIPTTSGTGSEVTPVAVISDETRGAKVGIASPYLIPQVAICDPELTVSCPPLLTAVSGADALTHAIEAFTTLAHPLEALRSEQHVFVGKNILSDHYAKLAVTNLFRYLERACRDGADIEGREGVMLAALAAGCAFGTAGTAAAHALQYPVGNLTHTAHGAGVATLLPYVMQYNRTACPELFAELADAIGVAGGGTVEERAQAFIDAVADLLFRIGIPPTLEALGLQPEQQDYVAEHSLNAARLVKNNPRPLDLVAMQAITRAAFSGDRASLTDF
jgi:alcohol dehydrogenase class IV